MKMFVFQNGVVYSPSQTPSLSTFLASHPGAYTTTRTYNNGKLILFWERHLCRLTNSAKILSTVNPRLLFESKEHIDPFSIRFMHSLKWDSIIRTLVNDNMRKALSVASKERESGDEMSITTLVSGDTEYLRGVESIDEGNACKVFDVYIHIGMYMPAMFGVGACLAVVGRGRDVAEAKYSDWVGLRKPLERFRPPFATELLLSNDGDHILEGCVTNFFVVCRKDKNDNNYSEHPFEIQTAPVGDGVLPGVIRQVIIDMCSRVKIPLREVAPSWSQNEMWEEAFITNSLRILQHVETIQVPNSWKSLELNSLENVTWTKKRFKEAPGRITAIIQEEIMKEVRSDGTAVRMI